MHSYRERAATRTTGLSWSDGSALDASHAWRASPVGDEWRTAATGGTRDGRPTTRYGDGQAVERRQGLRLYRGQ
jgi:hypothetical protein